jgi:hypothetical protein
MITELLPNILDCYDLSICGNAYVIKTQTKVQTFKPNFCFKRSTHEMNSTWRLRCDSKLEFARSMKIHSKDQTKKMED